MTGNTHQLRALSEVHHAIHTSADPMTGLRKALPSLSELFQARHASIDLFPFDGHQPELIESFHPEVQAESPAPCQAMMTESPNVGLLRAGGFAPVLRISDHLSQRQFEQTRFYKELFGPGGWRDQLGFAVQLPGAALGVTFHRDRVFNNDEAHLALHLQQCMAEYFASREELKDADFFQNAWQLLLEESGDALILPYEACELLDRYFIRHDDRRGVLPKELQQWIRGLRRRKEIDQATGCGARVVMDRPHGRLHIGLKVAQSPQQEILCLKEERGRRDFYRLKALRLTEREIEVIFWITQGKADADIAKILGIAHKTINKHVENILPKLAANNRTSAAVRAVEWLVDPTAEIGQGW